MRFHRCPNVFAAPNHSSHVVVFAVKFVSIIFIKLWQNVSRKWLFHHKWELCSKQEIKTFLMVNLVNRFIAATSMTIDGRR